ncbi:MAG: hypothetical protein JNK11_19205 [Alphaproteobacteria bacterium]|nr:hypothetical protein [Alphaproteobacteria bacterium]
MDGPLQFTPDLQTMTYRLGAGFQGLRSMLTDLDTNGSVSKCLPFERATMKGEVARTHAVTSRAFCAVVTPKALEAC